MRSGNIVGFDPAMPAKIVARDTGIECIGFNRVLALDEAKILPRYKKVQKTAHTADTAITARRRNVGRRINFELYLAAVAAALMRCHLSLPCQTAR